MARFSCEAVGLATDIFGLITYVQLACAYPRVLSRTLLIGTFPVFSGLRVFALWARNGYLLALVLVIGIVPVVINIVCERDRCVIPSTK